MSKFKILVWFWPHGELHSLVLARVDHEEEYKFSLHAPHDTLPHLQTSIHFDTLMDEADRRKECKYEDLVSKAKQVVNNTTESRL